MSGKKTALALPPVDVFEGIEAVNKAIESLKHITDSVYKTSGLIPGFAKNIKDETSIEELIKMYSSVSGRAKAYAEAAEDLLGPDSTYPAFKLNGATVADFKSDIKLRIDILNHKAKYDELVAIKKEYTELMDKQDRMKLLAQRVKNAIG